MERLLLLFDEENPFWNKELANLAGEDPQGLDSLLREGLLKRTPLGNYRLSRRGRDVLLDYGKCWGVPMPLPKDADEENALWTTKFRLLFDSSFIGRWSLKEYRQNVILSFYPGLSRHEAWISDDEGRIRWLYPDHPMVRALLERYPDTGMSAREKGRPDPGEAEKWFRTNGFPEGRLPVTVLFLSRYDFPHYARIHPLPQDTWRFMNADRMFCFRPPEPSRENLPLFVDRIAAVHQFLLYYRHVHLPGYTHFDTENQENLNWVLWVTENDKDAESLLRLLDSNGPFLADFELPLDLRTVSLETLEKIRHPYETIYDLLFQESSKIADLAGGS